MYDCHNTPETQTSKEIASQFISKGLGQHQNADVRKEVEILLRLTVEIEKDYGTTLNYLCNSISVHTDGYLELATMAEDIMKSGEENWGRIIILYVFAAKIAKKYQNNEQTVQNITAWLSSSIAKKSHWIRETGNGWDGFIKQFSKPHNEKGWFKVLFAASISLGTLAAIMFINKK